MLIEKGADNTSTNAAAALFEAATEGRAEVVSLLVQKGAPLDLQNEEGWTSLIEAAALGHADTVKVLCDAGADPTSGIASDEQPSTMHGVFPEPRIGHGQSDFRCHRKGRFPAGRAILCPREKS